MLKIHMPTRKRDAKKEALETMSYEERYGGGVVSRERSARKISQERALKGRSFGRGRDRAEHVGGRDPGK